jgi:hypothetical protein
LTLGRLFEGGTVDTRCIFEIFSLLIRLIICSCQRLRAFLVSCGFTSRMRDWPACVKFHAADGTQFRVSVFYWLRDRIGNVQYGACTPPGSIMGTEVYILIYSLTEVVGTYTHADVRTGVTPRTAPHVPHAFNACGPNLRE